MKCGMAVLVMLVLGGWCLAADWPRWRGPDGTGHVPAGGKIRLLILSGANNHGWKATTPVLKKMYEDSGRFTVDVTENVPALTGEDFARYDALVSNYTTYPNIEGHRGRATSPDTWKSALEIRIAFPPGTFMIAMESGPFRAARMRGSTLLA